MSDIDPQRITDQEQRDSALTPDASFIVQAPAGSGKTELLTQRYLSLLGQVESPEEILAVTFTRKAAAEMRNRIISAIYPPAGTDDKRLEITRMLAEQVIRRDRECGWQLASYPARLRIRTIDSVNAWLAATAPLVSGSSSLGISDTPGDLYREAAQRTVERVTHASGSAARSLLLHLDNRSDFLVGLLAGMLGRRDQWLDVVGTIHETEQATGAVRDALEQILYELVSQEIVAAAAVFAPAQRDELIELLHFAATNLCEKDPDSPWRAVLELDAFPAAAADQLAAWQWIAEFLLTKSNTLRKSLTVANGFPPGDGPQKDFKQRALSFLTGLREVPGSEGALAGLRSLPVPAYSEEQWDVLRSLLEILRAAAAELQLVFAERGEADYPAVAQGAIEALREDGDVPTELALRLDFRISHILIDEFQDTSSAQMKLLVALTEGWADGDGRTLFVVGDPMQSIYRFRKAEVGLFMELQDMELQSKSLPHLRLNPIILDTNFRSAPAVIDWVNDVFPRVMPAHGDITSGAVSYSPSNAARGADPDAFVREHALPKPSRVEEADRVVQLIADTLQTWPGENIGVLVRSRRHAELIAERLLNPAARNPKHCAYGEPIEYSGTGLENSIEKSVVQDLLCITRALSHLADRTAWLGLLRAPWCGLSLRDLEALAGGDHRRCIWDILNDAEVMQDLSPAGQERVARVKGVLEPVFAQRGSLPLRDVVEGIWTELGGPAFLTEAADLERSEAFFRLLDEFDTGGDCADAFDLHEQVRDKLKVEDRIARVNLMTVHKSKGLEFDTVILPALEAGTRGDDKPVLAWQEVVRPGGEPGLIIAPIERTGDDKDGIFEFARRLSRAQGSYEQDRLLYVATTRARKRMHLFFGVGSDEDGSVKPPGGDSLLSRLWPAIGGRHTVLEAGGGDSTADSAWRQPAIRRRAGEWEVPAAPSGYQVPTPAAVDEKLRDVTYDWASPVAKHVGIVVHRWLEKMTREGRDHYDAARLAELRPLFGRMLLAEDIELVELERATDLVVEALLNTLSDPTGSWLLDNTHADSACELPVTVMLDNRMASLVIDRTFVAADGIRWIVDYKTSSHEGGGLEAFFAEEERRYGEQLRSYEQAMQLLDPDHPIKTALYFPLLQELREIG